MQNKPIKRMKISKKSKLLTIFIVLLTIIVAYLISFFLFLSFTQCNQKNVSNLDLSLVFSCVELIIYMTYIYLLVTIICLFFVKEENSFLNFKGIKTSKIILICTIIMLFIFDKVIK